MVDDSNVEYGTFGGSFGAIKQRLNGFLSRYNRVKIGATTDPAQRWRRGYAGGSWTKMVVLVGSDKPGSTRSMERGLIRHARATNFRVRPENVLGGGEGIEDGHRRYFVYVVVE